MATNDQDTRSDEEGRGLLTTVNARAPRTRSSLSQSGPWNDELAVPLLLMFWVFVCTRKQHKQRCRGGVLTLHDASPNASRKIRNFCQNTICYQPTKRMSGTPGRIICLLSPVAQVSGLVPATVWPQHLRINDPDVTGIVTRGASRRSTSRGPFRISWGWVRTRSRAEYPLYANSRIYQIEQFPGIGDSQSEVRQTKLGD